jgi:hypothetical protein
MYLSYLWSFLFFFVISGPVWFKKKTKKVLLASRRHELSRRRKHSGTMKADLDVSESSSRTDYVFFIPPPPFFTGRRADFHLSLDDAWYGRVTLLFRMKFRHDSLSGEIREVECASAMIDVLYNYADGRYCTKAHKSQDFTNIL